MAGGEGDQRRTLQDIATLGVEGFASSIAWSNLEANNSGLKSALIFMVRQSHFGGTPLADRNLHISIFLELPNTLKLNRVSTDAIRLRLFPFSLKDKERAWLPFFGSRMHHNMG